MGHTKGSACKHACFTYNDKQTVTSTKPPNKDHATMIRAKTMYKMQKYANNRYNKIITM